MEELELIVTDTDRLAEPSPLATVRSATGTARMLDLRGPDEASVVAAAAILRLESIAAVDEPMGRIEVIEASHRVLRARAT